MQRLEKGKTKYIPESVSQLRNIIDSTVDKKVEYVCFALHILRQFRKLPERSFVILLNKLQSLITNVRFQDMRSHSPPEGTSRLSYYSYHGSLPNTPSPYHENLPDKQATITSQITQEPIAGILETLPKYVLIDSVSDQQLANISGQQSVLRMSQQKFRKRYLTQKEIEYAAAHLSESEDEFENEEESDEELEIMNLEQVPVELEDGVIIFPPTEIEEENRIFNSEEKDSEDEDGIEKSGGEFITHTPRNPKEARELKEKHSKIIWRKKNLVLNAQQSEFRGNSVLPSSISELTTPFSFFKYLFEENLFEKIANESNLYSIQKDPNKPAMLSAADIKQYLGTMNVRFISRLQANVKEENEGREEQDGELIESYERKTETV
ncbi:hypothetical protein QE152_g8237 [Popillia japonica]|uniref:Uncharacterized protein n=1 Tax=Popillia japonica TaxID=7064 RepID=A0AAW1M4P9_POPJA